MRTMMVAVMLAGALFVPTAQAESETGSAPIRVFDATELSMNQYTVIRRIWADHWRSAFDVPKFADAGDAVQSLVAEASKAGADGLIDVHCLNARRGQGPDAFFCQGNAIRLKQ